MLGGIVKRDPAIEICSPFRDVSRKEQRTSHEFMPDHERNGRALLLGKRKELRREVATSVAIECHKICSKETVEDGVKKERVFGGFAELSACSISTRAWLTATWVSGVASPLL